MENNIVFGSEIQQPVPVFAEFGKKAYLIVHGNGIYDSGKSFIEKCPCCGGAGKIQYNGFEVKCSVCSTVKTSITLKDWVVEEYIVNSITASAPDYKNAYGKNRKKGDLPRVTGIKGFCRTANGYSNVKTHDIPYRDRDYVDPDTDKVDLYGAESFAFTTKAKAETMVAHLKQKDRDKLAQFNADHSTAYEYPF